VTAADIMTGLHVRWHRHATFDDVDWADMIALARRFQLPENGPAPGFASPRRVGERKLHSPDAT
jgi:hypothetical protein